MMIILSRIREGGGRSQGRWGKGQPKYQTLHWVAVAGAEPT